VVVIPGQDPDNQPPNFLPKEFVAVLARWATESWPKEQKAFDNIHLVLYNSDTITRVGSQVRRSSTGG